MTEEEKIERLQWEFPDMPLGMAKAIIKWNKNHSDEKITNRMLEKVTENANIKEKLNFESLLSSDKEEAYGELIFVLSSRDLAEKICKNSELERMFERYAFSIQNLNFGDGRTVDEVCPLK